MKNCTTGTQSPLESLLASCKPYVERLAHKFARVSHSPLLEFDDYVSIAMVKLCEVAEKVLSADIPVIYGCKVAEHAMIDAYYDLLAGPPTVSLDAPLSPDQPFTLASLIVSPSPASSGNACAPAVRTAVKRLPSRRQECLAYFYGFEGYGKPHGSAEVGRTLGISRNSVCSNTTRARQNLRQDAELCTAVGVEVQR